LLGACKEEEKPAHEAFIFGQWDFQCSGHCLQIYKYVGVKRYTDQRNIPTSFTPQEEDFSAFTLTLKQAFP
jgi:hypothetical protein